MEARDSGIGARGSGMGNGGSGIGIGESHSRQQPLSHCPTVSISPPAEAPLPPLPWSPSPRQAVGGKIKEKKATPPLCLLVHPRLGVGGERSETEGGRLPQEAIKMAPHIFKGRLPPFTIHHLPFTIFKRPPSTTIVVPLPRQVEVHSTSSHTSSYSNSDTLRSRFPATRACYPDTSG
jgi:hypothetical protein